MSHSTAKIPDKTMVEIATHVLTHQSQETAKAFDVSNSTVQRAIRNAKDGEYGDALQASFEARPVRITRPAEPKRYETARERHIAIAQYALTHSYSETAKAYQASETTVNRCVTQAREGGFGEELMRAYRERVSPKSGPKHRSKRNRKRKSEPEPELAGTPKQAAKVRRAPPRGTDLDAMVELMIDKAKHHEAVAARLRAAAAALADE